MLIVIKSLGYLLATARIFIVLALISSHGAVVSLLPSRSRWARARVIKSFGRTITWALGVKVSLQGEPSNTRAILISNHRSYVDIPLLAGLSPVVFLAKIEVASWPVIGWAARKAGTVFVNRSDLDSREASRQALRERLSEGLSVLIFSEGTTSERGTLLPLKRGMFNEAATANLPIQLVYLEFAEDADSWVEMSVGEHFYQRFSRWRTQVRVVYRERLMRAQPDETSPGARMHEEAIEWLHDQIKREVGEVREGNLIYLEEQRQRAMRRQELAQVGSQQAEESESSQLDSSKE